VSAHEDTAAPSNGLVPPAPQRDDRPTFNPYTGQKRTSMTHRVFEGIKREIAERSDELTEAGWPHASQAELVQAILHFGMPADMEAAGRLLQDWGAVKLAPPRRIDP
jgi:hypothetical protein